ncbi:hypothetical protein [Novosphingobium aquae]|uniref:Uncharacterized protein n=1 Tax=Novosphingobium aquae TaxID=3133435 RepID=A0ABU8SBY4_9SPHN
MAAPFDDVNAVRKTYFIRESERDVATPANNTGYLPQLEADAKIHRAFLPMSRKFNVFEAMNGTTTPVPVTLSPDGSIIKSDANVTMRQSFLGFMKTNQASVDPSVLGTPVSGSGATTSFTANAGNNRVILIFAAVGDNSGIASLPSAFSWNGQSFTSVITASGNSNCKMQAWVLPIGDSASNQTFNITRTGGNGSISNIFHAVCLDKTNQTLPANASITGFNAAGNASATLVPTQVYGKTVIAAYSRLGTANVTTAGATDIISGGAEESAIVTHEGNVSVTMTGTADNAVIAVALAGVNATQADVEFDGIVGGFSGLTIGSKYYVSDTIGTIQTTPGTNNIPIGIAISATEILIKTAYPN